MPQHVQVINAVGARSHPGHDQGDLGIGIDPEPISDPDMLGDQVTQAAAPGQPHHRHQPGNETRCSSSKTAYVLAAACVNRTYDVPSRTGWQEV